MRSTRSWSALISLLALAAAGCPSEGTPDATPAPTQDLRLAYDPPQGGTLEVGETIQLRMRLGRGSESLMGALIAPPPESPTQFFADPADAVEFDATTAQARLLRPGRVRIWVCCAHEGTELTSNGVELEIGAPTGPDPTGDAPDDPPDGAPAAAGDESAR